MSVVPFMNCFEVPTGQEDAFLALWQEVNEYMKTKPGYVRHRLHRSLAPEAKFRFINYAEWETVEHWRAAHDDTFRRLVARPEWSGFSSTNGLYEVVHAGNAADSAT